MPELESVKLPAYPELERIVNLYPVPQILLGKEIMWTEKRDGTNLRIACVDGEIVIATRHQENASAMFKRYVESTEAYPQVVAMLREHSGFPENPVNDFRRYPVVFGELLVKGKSPARFEVHDKHEFVVFDIWSQKDERYLPYNSVYQYCYHFNIPVVECWAMTKHATLESLYGFRETMLEKAKSCGREGVVLKAFDGKQHIFAKEKVDLPRIETVVMEEGGVSLPFLPESEVYGAIAKAEADLGEEFSDKTKAMPLIAKYVNEEQKKHVCSKPRESLFRYYVLYLEERRAING